MIQEAEKATGIGRHRTVAFERLPSQAEVCFYNSLPNCIKNAPTPLAFKIKLKIALVSKDFHRFGDILELRWVTFW